MSLSYLRHCIRLQGSAFLWRKHVQSHCAGLLPDQVWAVNFLGFLTLMGTPQGNSSNHLSYLWLWHLSSSVSLLVNLWHVRLVVFTSTATYLAQELTRHIKLLMHDTAACTSVHVSTLMIFTWRTTGKTWCTQTSHINCAVTHQLMGGVGHSQKVAFRQSSLKCTHQGLLHCTSNRTSMIRKHSPSCNLCMEVHLPKLHTLGVA